MVTARRPSRRILVRAGLTAAVVVALSAWFVGSSLASPDTGEGPHEVVPGEFWPPFTAIIREEGILDLGESPDGHYAKAYRLEFRSRGEWTATTLENTQHPDAAGTVIRVAGGIRYVEQDPAKGPSYSAPLPPDYQGYLSPGRWFVLYEAIDRYERREVEPGRLEFAERETLDCADVNAAVDWAPCPPGQASLEYVNRAVVDEATRIPLLVEQRVGPYVEYRVTVEDLQVLGPTP